MRTFMLLFFCVTLVSCIQIGRSHPCGVTSSGELVECDERDKCVRGWCVPKNWGDSSVEGGGLQGGVERSSELFDDRRFDGGMIPEERRESTQVDRCIAKCQLGQKKRCFEGGDECDVNGVCKGRCREGIKFCIKKTTCVIWSQCLEQILPKTESCNGEDDDCDGKTDEDCDCLPQQTRRCGDFEKGECQKGTQTCDLTGKWGGCTGERLPVAEFHVMERMMIAMVMLMKGVYLPLLVMEQRVTKMELVSMSDSLFLGDWLLMVQGTCSLLTAATTKSVELTHSGLLQIMQVQEVLG